MKTQKEIGKMGVMIRKLHTWEGKTSIYSDKERVESFVEQKKGKSSKLHYLIAIDICSNREHIPFEVSFFLYVKTRSIRCRPLKRINIKNAYDINTTQLSSCFVYIKH